VRNFCVGAFLLNDVVNFTVIIIIIIKTYSY